MYYELEENNYIVTPAVNAHAPKETPNYPQAIAKISIITRSH